MPKGLRSFDEHDADFFLELLPGPRDRDGLPDSIRFWKRKIEQIDPDLTFKVGLIYGPSGCGKSSLVKAGLLPRLGKHVLRFTSRRPPTRPKPGCSRAYARCVQNCAGIGVGRFASEVAAGSHLAAGAQSAAGPGSIRAVAPWQAEVRRTPNWSPLFGTAMASMSRPLCWCGTISGSPPAGSCGTWRSDWSKGRTAPLVDLFDPRHANKVLTAFGRAYGALPENDRRSQRRSKFIPGSIDFRARPGREDHFRAVGSLRRDGQREALDPGHAQRGRRHGRNRCDIPGGNLQRLDRPSRASPAPESRPGGVEEHCFPRSAPTSRGR